MENHTYVCTVYIRKQGKDTWLYEYYFVGIVPVVGDVISRDDGNDYTIIERKWNDGILTIIVTDEHSTGIVKA